MTLLLLGASARWITACARLIATSGRPTYSTAGRGVGGEQRLGIGEPDVLAREDDEPARDEARVLARFEHAREPVETRVGIRAADRLDERGDDVVVLVVAVADAAERERGLRIGERDGRAVVLHGERVRDLEDREEVARVALTLVDEMLQCVVVDLGRFVAEAALDIGEGATSQLFERAVVEGFEPEQRAAGEQRTGEREERVLGRRADEHEEALFDEREQHVLLGAGEAVHLVEEEDGALPRSPSRARARSATSRTSLTPALTALSVSKAFSLTPATRRAMVVLPVPGGPQMMTDDSRSDSMSTRSGLPGPEVLLADDLVERPRPQAAPRAAPCAPTAPPPPKQTDQAPRRPLTHPGYAPHFPPPTVGSKSGATRLFSCQRRAVRGLQ